MSIRLLLLTLLAAAPVWTLGAQNVKSIAVGQGASYTDHISLAEDSRDMDVLLKFVFDEQKNSLTVSALSYRSLFVFRDATRYKSVVHGRRLNPEHLPYVAEADKGTRFYISKSLKKSLPRPHRKYVFNSWIEYDGMQPAQSEYKMVNDYIEQEFQILSRLKRTYKKKETLGDAVFFLDFIPFGFREMFRIKVMIVNGIANKRRLATALGEVFLDFRLGIMRISPKIVGPLDSLSEKDACCQTVSP